MTTKINPDIKARIVQAANELLIEGIEEPTNAQVLEKMGKGSLSHVSPVMREWRATRKQEASKPYDIPTELENLMGLSLRQIWTRSTELSRAELHRFKQSAEAQLKECEVERDEALSEIRALEEQISVLHSTLAAKEQDCDRLTQELKTVEEAYRTEQTKNAVLEKALKTQQENLNTLQAELIEIAKHRAS